MAGAGIMGLKLLVFAVTNSAVVLSDALESIINLVAAGVMLFTLRLANRPPDAEHHYGHGKAEFMAVAFEGALVLLAAAGIALEAVRRVSAPPALGNLGRGAAMLGGVALLSLGLGVFVLMAGRRHRQQVLIADGKHLIADVASTLVGLGGLLAVRWTGIAWIDPLLALVIAGVIVVTGARLMWESIGWLMDKADPEAARVISAILDEEVKSGAILGHHKVRCRRSGGFQWVEMHLQVAPDLSVRAGHDVASRIEGRIERALGKANATAHVEPAEAGKA